MKKKGNAEIEGKTATSSDNEGSEDLIIDDSAVAVNTEKGLVGITGCPHSRIWTIIGQAKKITGESKVHGVNGVFYLRKNDEVLEKIFFLFAGLKK